MNTLREWKHACPKGELDLVFPNGEGNVESHSNIISRGLIPTLVVDGHGHVLNEDGKPVLDEQDAPLVEAKYAGMHALRHFYASWLINRVADGGLGLPPKVVQERLGHSSITMTFDTYGHLFPRHDDAAELDAAEMVLLGVGDGGTSDAGATRTRHRAKFASKIKS